MQSLCPAPWTLVPTPLAYPRYGLAPGPTYVATLAALAIRPLIVICAVSALWTSFS